MEQCPPPIPGLPGPPGLPADDGEQGDAGSDGSPGLDAYQLLLGGSKKGMGIVNDVRTPKCDACRGGKEVH